MKHRIESKNALYVLLILGIIFLVSLSIILPIIVPVFVSLDNDIQQAKMEYPLLKEDFGEYMTNGFCAYTDDDGDTYFPNGTTIDVYEEPIYGHIKLVSKDRIIYEFDKRINWKWQTLIVSSSWDLTDQKVIYTFDFKTDYARCNQNGILYAGKSDSKPYYKSLYRFDFFKGEVTLEELPTPIKWIDLISVDYYGKLDKQGNTFWFPYHGDKYTFTTDLIKTEIREKMEKWHFKPRGWYVDYKGEIYITFNKYNGGQDGIVIMRYNQEIGTFDKYQVILLSSDFETETILPIYDSFADEVIIK